MDNRSNHNWLFYDEDQSALKDIYRLHLQKRNDDNK